MKKIFVSALILMLCLTAAGCGGSGNDNNSSTDSTSSAVSEQSGNAEQQASQDQKNESSADASSDGASDASIEGSSDTSEESRDYGNNLVMKSFGELWMGDEYYIDVMMTSEYDPSKLASASEGTSGETKTAHYDYIIAVDFANNKAGLNMISDNGATCYVIKNGRLYDIDHSTKTYTEELYGGQAENFGEEFTVKRCLGTINNCTLIDSGTTEYEGNQVKFEKYTLASQDPAYKDPEIIYYFAMNGKPVAEIVTTEAGKTTFVFRTVSGTIPVEDILEIPAGYTKVDSHESQVQESSAS